MDASSMTLLLFGALCLSPSASWGRLQDPESPTQDPQRGPHLTGCLSREQETFNCWWSAGSFQNLTEPGALRLFYSDSVQYLPTQVREWKECPQYSSTRPNECHFSKNYTQVWVPYCVELRSVEQNITYDSTCFTVENIVAPDPPVNLNWTLLNVSRSGLNFDIMVRWEHPPSAAVAVGWIILVYQVQYRLVNTSNWDKIDQESGTHQPIYGLQTDKTYEVRVRSKMRGYNFGEYSDTITVRVAEIPYKDKSLPMILVVVFAVVGMVILLMLIIFSQQQRLMVILLPPVPAPTIKGIDSELLKKGRLDDLNSILSSQHMYKPEMFRDEPWVEFIELDMDDANDKPNASDTQHLLGRCLGSFPALGLKDDDSGRASCYDPELPNEALLMGDLLPPLERMKAMEAGEGDEPTLADPRANSPSTRGPGTPAVDVVGSPDVSSQRARPPVQTQVSCSPNWASMDFYAQVSDVTPAGGVVLSPGLLLPQSTAPDTKKESESSGEKGQLGEMNEKDEVKIMKKKEEEGMLKFHLLVVNPDGGYTSESVARHISSEAPQAPLSPPPPPSPPPAEDEQPAEYQRDPATCPAPPAMPGEYQLPYLLPDANPAVATMTPVSDYTVVQDVDAQHGFLLNASVPQSPPNPAKHLPTMPTMPIGYLSPDLMGTLMP